MLLQNTHTHTPREVEGVSEAGLLALLGRQRLDRLQVEVVVQVEVAQALSVDEEVEHVVPLTAHLQPDFHPVQLRLPPLVRIRKAERVVSFIREYNHVARQDLHSTTNLCVIFSLAHYKYVLSLSPHPATNVV